MFLRNGLDKDRILFWTFFSPASSTFTQFLLHLWHVSLLWNVFIFYISLSKSHLKFESTESGNKCSTTNIYSATQHHKSEQDSGSAAQTSCSPWNFSSLKQQSRQKRRLKGNFLYSLATACEAAAANTNSTTDVLIVSAPPLYEMSL